MNDLDERSAVFEDMVRDRLQSLRPPEQAALLAKMVAALHQAAPENTKDVLEIKLWEV